MSHNRGSVSSQHNNSEAEISHRQEDTNFDDFSNEELRLMLEQVFVNNRILQLENDLFEKYLNKHDPRCLQAMAQVLEAAKIAPKVAGNPPLSPALSFSGSNGSFREKQSISLGSVRSGSQKVTPSQVTSMTLSLSQRKEMLDQEIEELNKGLERLIKVTESKKIILTARKDEIESRAKETFQTMDNFEKHVVKRGADQQSGKIPAEIFIKFIDDWIKATDIMIEKLRLKTVSLKRKIKNTKYHLVQRELLGEDLRPVDFEELRVENEQFAKKYASKTQDFLKAKAFAAKLDINSSVHKRKLHCFEDKLELTRKQIALKQQQIEKLKINRELKINELKKEEKKLISLLELMENYRVPEVMEYVKLKSQFQDVHKNYKRLIRQKNILQMRQKYSSKQTTLVPSKLEMKI